MRDTGTTETEKKISYDCLTIVHFDYTPVQRNAAWSANISKAIAEFEAQSKPVFLVPSFSPRWKDHGLDLRNGIYLYASDDSNTDAQELSAIVGKAPSEITIAFGGMYGERCVYNWAEYLCERVECPRPVYRQYWKHGPIGRGYIIEEITEFAE